MHTVTHQPHTMNRRKYSTSRQRQTIQLPHAALYSSVNRSASSSSFFRSLTDWCCIVASVTDSKRPNRSRLEKSTAWTVQSTQYTNPRETNFFYSPPRDRIHALRMQVEHLPTELNHLQKRKETNKKIKWGIFSNFYKARTYSCLIYSELPIHFLLTNSIWFTILLYLNSYVFELGHD